MLSYRHAFHAGNHADILKHFVLAQVLSYLNQKDKPYWYIDTHAGAGMYALDAGYALQNAEFETGIARLIDAPQLPLALIEFSQLIKSINVENKLSLYPGSPAIAEQLIRADDKMRLFELHPSDNKLLLENFNAQRQGFKSKSVKIEMQDGFAGIKAILPPPTKRGVVLIDPPYEEKQDYRRVVTCIKESLQRFATGTYLVWYPLLQRDEPLEMVNKLQNLDCANWLNVTLSVQTPSADGFGMFGSGLFIFNPPYTLPKILDDNLPTLVDLLGQDDGASYQLTSKIS
ncbi:MAG: 23S rRNA (adenine(2030)-N(6))-methyltransferase RlmJ [Methylophilaceae bacterium]|nr:23S rRNA (adenine(2030)-N(6))-methyltransferase RlmJ [Methylophilaceae bacterium]